MMRSLPRVYAARGTGEERIFYGPRAATRSQSELRSPGTSHRGPMAHASRRSPGYRSVVRMAWFIRESSTK
jgi:hypothetical protein